MEHIVFIDALAGLSDETLSRKLMNGDGEILYFESADQSGEKRGCSQVPFNLADLRDEVDVWPYFKILKEARSAVMGFMSQWTILQRYRTILEPWWPAEKVQLHFQRILEREVRVSFLKIRLIDWYLRQKETVSSELWIEGSPVDALIIDYGNRYNVTVKIYQSAEDKSRESCWIKAACVLKAKFDKSSRPDDYYSSLAAKDPKVAVGYYHRSLSQEEEFRTELFWMNTTEVSPGNTVIFNYHPSGEEAAYQEHLSHGMKIYTARDIAGYTRQSNTAEVSRVEALFCSELWRRRSLKTIWDKDEAFVFDELMRLIPGFSKWTDLYEQEGIKVSVTVQSNEMIQRSLALGALDGISVTYQTSLSNLEMLPLEMLGGEDVQMLFSREGFKEFEALGEVSPQVLELGYVYGKAAKVTERATSDLKKIRDDMAKQGAVFIIGFFDENSGTLWNQCADHDDVCREYSEFLDWMEQDESIGVIVKPKKGSDLLERLAPIGERVQAALASGRLHIISDEQHISKQLPSHVAAVSDVTVSLLVGGTAGFEAAHSGTPSIIIDSLNNLNHPWWSWAEGSVLFHNFEDARLAVDQYRQGTQMERPLGEWKNEFPKLDRFQDGKAGERIGAVIGHMLSEFRAGKSKSETMKKLRDWYQQNAVEDCQTNG